MNDVQQISAQEVRCLDTWADVERVALFCLLPEEREVLERSYAGHADEIESGMVDLCRRMMGELADQGGYMLTDWLSNDHLRQATRKDLEIIFEKGENGVWIVDDWDGKGFCAHVYFKLYDIPKLLRAQLLNMVLKD